MAELYISERGNPYKRFRFIHNGNGAVLERGDVVEYELAATADHPGQSVVDGTAADPLVAGVVVGQGLRNHDDIADGDFGWIQVSGFCDYITTDGTVTAGDPLISGAAVADVGTVGTNDGAFFGVALADDNASNELTSAILKWIG